jgi:hypothetical protein
LLDLAAGSNGWVEWNLIAILIFQSDERTTELSLQNETATCTQTC